MIDIDAAKREVMDWIAAAVHVPADQIDLVQPLEDVGLDSNDAVHLVCTIEAVLRTELPEDVMSEVHCVGDILRLMEQHAAAAGSDPVPVDS